MQTTVHRLPKLVKWSRPDFPSSAKFTLVSTQDLFAAKCLASVATKFLESLVSAKPSVLHHFQFEVSFKTFASVSWRDEVQFKKKH